MKPPWAYFGLFRHLLSRKAEDFDFCAPIGYHFSGTTTESVLKYAEVVADRGTEVEILRFAA